MKFKNSAIYYIIILFAVMVSFYQLTEYMDRSQKRDNSVTKVEVQAKDQGSEGETLDTRLPGKGLENSKPDENIEIRKPTVEGNRAEEKKVPVNSAENTNAASQKTSSNQNSPKKEVTEGNGASTNKVSPKENQKIEAIKIEHEQEATSVAAQPKKQTPKKAEPKVDNVKSSKLIQPVAGKISAPFGLAFSQFYQDYRLHSGIDIKVKSGTSVKAALHGTILEINKSNQDNITITIDHGQGLVTTYAHLGKSKVEKGDLVQQGQTIGIIDNPGLTEEGQGSHLHFEVRENKKLVNPEEYLK